MDLNFRDLLVISNTEFSSTLVINQLRLEHSGRYECVADNGVAKASYGSQLLVYGREIEAVASIST